MPRVSAQTTPSVRAPATAPLPHRSPISDSPKAPLSELDPKPPASPWTSYSTGTPQLSPSTANPMLGRKGSAPSRAVPSTSSCTAYTM